MPRAVRLVAVGKVREAYLKEGMAEYEKRLRPYCKLEIIELKDEGMEKEAERMEKYLGPNTFIFDERGKAMDSPEFAELVKSGELSSLPLTFLVGGPFGISPSLKGRARLLSLSRMTFTHEMARLFVLEQLYRALLANSGRAYQK